MYNNPNGFQKYKRMKYKNIISIGLICIGLIVGKAHAQNQTQKTWSLEQCLNHALENNIRVKQQALNVNYYENQKTQAKYDLAPSVNASVGQGFSFGRSKNVTNNQYYDMNSSNTSVGVSADVTLFNGMAKYNRIKQREYEWQASLQDLEKAKNDISVSIMSAYLDILFNKELVNTATSQVELSKKQIEYDKKQVEVGNKPKGALLETEAQKANEELNLTNYKNKLQIALLNLSQLLELHNISDFDVLMPNFDMSDIDKKLLAPNSIFEQAVSKRPEIQSQELKLKSMERANAIAKAQLYPTLSLGAYYNNDYQNFEGNKRSFTEQMKNNGKEGINLTLRIPIFNGLSARTNYSNSKINYENTKYELQLEKNNLLKDIQQVHANAVAAMQKYYASEKAFGSTKEAFRYIDEKFKLGLVTALEYSDAKNKMSNAESTFIQAKYEYIFRVKILDFYKGEKLSL